VSDQLCEYYGLITDLDLQVGRILAALEARGAAENTLVLYAADHGLAMGSHGLLGKQSLYEHSSGLPLILAGPGVPKGARSDALVYLYDLYPTLTEVGGAEKPEDLHATSLWPVIRGEQETVRATLYTSLGKHQRAVRDGRWKLIRYPEVEVTQLFDLREDPLELVNLADRFEHAGTLSRLRRELEQWQAFAGDAAPWTAEKTRSPEIDLTGASRKPDRWQPRWVREKYFDTK
jgi:arylsulfatase A-like enzyme